ncbi:hypothetical protein IWC96_07760 [Brevundimonas sp. BAL450]|jgi:uncharacterized membrane protein|uniref:Fibronectin, type III domain protein n=1 Tax=Brevundimonas abyssalis TAR-001 TaxID=1391729 RepID=A0A8E0KJE9_9CAUL|nr:MULTISPECIES: fibronectin type III domain protein [Brevundimonas]MBG7615178.1 hypothetical protein [Brevundimonas sp. BAL450]GAD58204.1 fibronectin, type III domain protein [Brevundimonas abyssalis TAR-001]
MAEPGEPRTPEDDFDDQVGFCSPQSVAGRPVEPEPAPEPVAHPAPEPEPEPRMEDAVREPEPPTPEPEPEPAPVFVSRAERRRALDEEPKDRLTWALTIYALILFAVPTLGFSAVLGLLAVTGRTVNASPFLLSHYVYQQRTLWTAAIAALVGLILIVVNLGIFVLFLLAVWTIARGAAGIWRLKNAQPISNPRTWFF